MQAGAILTMAALLVVHAVRLVSVTHSSPWLGASLGVGAVIGGYLFADFMSGCVHFFFDRFLEETTPVIGPMFVKPFRIHHIDPIDITRHGFLPTNGSNSLVTIVPLLGLFVLDIEKPVWFFLVALVVVAAVATFGTNQFHKWSHEPTPHPLVAWLQRHHLVLPVDHHAIHHTWPHESHYCITTGWMNAFLSAIGFWKAASRAISLVLVEHRDPPPAVEPIPLPWPPASSTSSPAAQVHVA
jgi:ubiquitin-conjugating enzyme E2 variant